MLTVLELFCGIGGCAAALGADARVRAAVDQNREALTVYAANFPHPVFPDRIDAASPARWDGWRADLWWMSPPCPPFTTRGLRRDLNDPRTAGFVTVLQRIAERRPPYVAFENVPGFAGSNAHRLLRDTLDRAGYSMRDTLLCPTELGGVSRRQRLYLVAARDRLLDWPSREGPPRPLAEVLDDHPAADLWCEEALAVRYGHALHVVDAHDPGARTACFTAAYGRSPVRSGSYLATRSGLRRFSPGEILRLLDFPASFCLPVRPARALWPLVGNSLSVRAVRWVLSAVPGAA
jgi:site-specific DNA-cytosine methylase